MCTYIYIYIYIKLCILCQSTAESGLPQSRRCWTPAICRRRLPSNTLEVLRLWKRFEAFLPIPVSVKYVNTRPTCGQCRTPPIPPMSMFTDMRKVSAIGL